MLSTKNRRHEYLANGDGRVAKFMPRYDGPYTILEARPETSTYVLDVPRSAQACNTFHVSQLRAFVANDQELFPSRELPCPGPVVTPDGQLENFIERIHQEIGEEKIIHYNHWMQWIMVYMTRYWISTLHKTYSHDYNGLSFPHQFPDVIDEKKVGRLKKYLVRWSGYSPEDDEWLSKKELEDCEALDNWERNHPPT